MIEGNALMTRSVSAARVGRLGTLTAVALLFALPAPGRAQVAGMVKMPTDQGTLQAVALGYRASKILHTPVYNLSGGKIGKVDDIILTPARGASYFIVDVGGFLGLGVKRIAVPSNLFKIVDKKVVLPGVDTKELKSLPAFNY
jgi:sporulation protein YlmC with PRC-barrel domain